MDVAGFQDLLDRLGDDLSTWPEQPRHAAEALLRRSDEARAAFAEAQGLRRRLSPAPITAPAGLIDRIMQRVRTDVADLSPPLAASPDRKPGPDND